MKTLYNSLVARRSFMLGAFAIASVPNTAFAQDTEFGRFEGDLTLTDADAATCQMGGPSTNAEFRTATQLTFIDPDELSWTVPSGTCVNGASIPQVFWSFVGSPWSRDYRRATVVHDYYCVTKARDYKATHLVLYNAMRADGVSEARAKTMYYAVYHFGPTWGAEAERALQQAYEALERIELELQMLRLRLHEMQARGEPTEAITGRLTRSSNELDAARLHVQSTQARMSGRTQLNDEQMRRAVERAAPENLSLQAIRDTPPTIE
jgi:hypothetical protein